MISSALVQFPGGYLADKYGRKKLITTMTFMMGLSQILYAIAPNWKILLIAAIISGFCSIYGPALQAITMDSLPKEKRGKISGSRSFFRSITGLIIDTRNRVEYHQDFLKEKKSSSIKIQDYRINNATKCLRARVEFHKHSK